MKMTNEEIALVFAPGTKWIVTHIDNGENQPDEDEIDLFVSTIGQTVTVKTTHGQIIAVGNGLGYHYTELQPVALSKEIEDALWV